MSRLLRIPTLALALAACGTTTATAGTEAAEPPPEGREAAVFAGGCFWCMEKPFEVLDGVDSVVSGYTGGEMEGPSYEQVASHKTDHREAVRVVYDPDEVSYDRLLEVFWHNVDPTQADGQFCDKGEQYTTAIYVSNKAERKAAETSKKEVAKALEGTIVTPIVDASTFWVAEEYHQDFYKTNPARYTSYRMGCGRDARLKELWGEKAGH